ncbi:MAG: 4Fe-4S binding protein [Candidatus Omnitrophica bacterium]|nr:4Fe-4S binding protein [Candidatus Omnitrophota bacterium]MCM8831891.1 4Fe-4S binding protein [Candidatus Omnitrophota bacterium]
MAEVIIEKDKCKGCQLCIFYCPTKKIVLSSELNKKGIKFAKPTDNINCIGCGFCFVVCPDNCIEIYDKK